MDTLFSVGKCGIQWHCHTRINHWTKSLVFDISKNYEAIEPVNVIDTCFSVAWRGIDFWWDFVVCYTRIGGVYIIHPFWSWKYFGVSLLGRNLLRVIEQSVLVSLDVLGGWFLLWGVSSRTPASTTYTQTKHITHIQEQLKIHTYATRSHKQSMLKNLLYQDASDYASLSLYKWPNLCSPNLSTYSIHSSVIITPPLRQPAG